MLTITHDIKAPVGSILGYTDLLERITTEERQRFYLNNMQSSANHLLSLVKSLLDYHRLDAHKMDVNQVSFNPTNCSTPFILASNRWQTPNSWN